MKPRPNEPPKFKNVIAYYRVSTQRQAKSGLGLEAQQMKVKLHAGACRVKILGEYTEVESGTKKDRLRPQLTAALAHAKRAGAQLVVAKLDRLASNVYFVAKLMESDAEFICLDVPSCNRLTMQILAAVAEDEARQISERTIAALYAHRMRGGMLGAMNPACRNLTSDGARRGQTTSAKISRERAQEELRDLVPIIEEFVSHGLSMATIATRLNALGHTTRAHTPWTYRAVWKQLMCRFGIVPVGRRRKMLQAAKFAALGRKPKATVVCA